MGTEPIEAMVAIGLQVPTQTQTQPLGVNKPQKISNTVQRHTVT